MQLLRFYVQLGELKKWGVKAQLGFPHTQVCLSNIR